MRVLGIKEYAAIVSELSSLQGTHFQRIIKIEDGSYRLKLGSEEVLIALGVAVYKTRRILPGEPDQFCQRVKKELDNARLISVRQQGQDRIICFDFDKGTIIVEGFGKGNIIFVKDNIILAAVKHETWSDREILPKKEYKAPRATTKTDLRDVFSDKYVIVDLLKLPLGKEYAQELLARAGIEEKKPSSTLSETEKERIASEYGAILNENMSCVFVEGTEVVDFGLVKFSKYSHMEATSTFSDALEKYYSVARTPPNPKLEKLKSRLEHQEKHLEELVKEYEEKTARGTYVYDHLHDLQTLKHDMETIGIDGIEDAFAKQGAKVNKKNKTVEIQLD